MIDVKRSLRRVHKYAAEYLSSRIRDERRECLSGVGAESILIHIAINILLTQNIYLLFYEEAILYCSTVCFLTRLSAVVQSSVVLCPPKIPLMHYSYNTPNSHLEEILVPEPPSHLLLFVVALPPIS